MKRDPPSGITRSVGRVTGASRERVAVIPVGQRARGPEWKVQLLEKLNALLKLDLPGIKRALAASTVGVESARHSESAIALERLRGLPL